MTLYHLCVQTSITVCGYWHVSMVISVIDQLYLFFCIIILHEITCQGYIHTVAYMTLIHGMYPSNIIQLKYI